MTATHDNMLLQLDGAGVTYPDGTVALKPTNLALRRGEITVLLGVSGAGKSTLLRTLNQLVMPTIGNVACPEQGPLVTADAMRRHRRRTAMVFQHHQLIARHTALSNVLTGRLGWHRAMRTLLPLPRADQELALQCLERVGLADKALVRVDQLSGGQRQRVGIARALAQQPQLILADEPVASLDPATSEQVLSLLREICAEGGIGAVISLHQLEYARRYADRIIGLASAQVVFDGRPGALTAEEVARIYAPPSRTSTKSSRCHVQHLPAHPEQHVHSALELSR